jgi:hypothetical protein
MEQNMGLNPGRRILTIILLSTIGLGASTPMVTLYPPADPVTKKYDEGKSCFNFKRGTAQGNHQK